MFGCWIKIIGSDVASDLTSNTSLIGNGESVSVLMTKYAIKIDMANTIEKFEKYIYTRYADTHLDLDSVIKWVLEFIDHPSFSPGTNVLWDATEIATTSLNFSDMAEF